MIKICMLLNGPIKNDHRVIKTLTTLSKDAIIDLFYINGETNDHLLFENNIFLHSFDFKNSFKRKLTQHSLIGYEFNFFINKVVRSGKSYDYIWANDLPTLYPAYKIANKLNSKLVYDSHEIYIETLNQFFPTKPSFVKSIIFSSLLKVMKFHGSYIEKKIIKESHYFITVNDSLLNYFKKKHEIKNTCVVMNFPYLNKADFKKINLFEKNNWDNSAKLLLYQGVINKGRGLEIIINTLKILPDNFKLIIIGDGPIKKELKNLSLKLNLSKRIDFINKVSINELLNYTSSSHLGINLLENYNLSKKFASPNKLYEYIHAGIPVIASNTVENIKVFNKYNIGKLVENNPKIISENIQLIFKSDIDLFKQECNKAKQEFNWEIQEHKILSIIA